MKMLSARINWHKNAEKYLRHGFNYEAAHTDGDIINQVWLPDADGQLVLHPYQRGRESGLALYQQLKPQMNMRVKQQQTDYQTRSRLGRKLRKDANHFCELLITFSREVNPEHEGTALDDCAINTASRFAARHHLRVLVVDKHNDESKGHYHILLTAISEETKAPITRSVHKKELQKLQNIASEAFKPLGITRGVPLADKLKKTIAENPKESGESDHEYQRRIYKLANVKNRSVAQLHASLEADLAALELDAKELEAELSCAKTGKAEQQKELDKLNAEIDSINSLLVGQQAVYEHVTDAHRHNELVIKKLKAQLEQQEKNHELLREQERQIKQGEIERLEAELEAAAPYLKKAVEGFAVRVEREAPYLLKPTSSLHREDKQRTAALEISVKKTSTTPSQTLSDIQSPRKISSWVRLRTARRSFRRYVEEIERLKSKVTGWLFRRRPTEKSPERL